ncbi:MAG: hypothetical protein IPL53_18750 [Ignavibacteria bacterium]|nr:hypothetical protein [Ignavibacteria bacterium]
MNNILNVKNVYNYTYNYDYTEQVAVISNNQRSLYLGLGLQFNYIELCTSLQITNVTSYNTN